MIHEIGHLVSIHQSGSGVLVDTLQDLVKRTLNESIAQGLKTSKNFDITILMPMMTAVPQISYGRNQLQGGGGGDHISINMNSHIVIGMKNHINIG